MSDKGYQLKCYLCDRVHREEESVTSCVKCGGPLETVHDYNTIRQRLNMYSIKTTPISSLKYMAFYPIQDFQNAVSLQEGATPLIHAQNFERHGLNRVYIKNEGVNPTGCFKDRGTLVELTKAKEMGAKAICLASTGNMAASVAAYSAAAGIPCYVLVPEGTAIGKLAQTLSFGARVMQIRADYSKCAALAEKMAKTFGYYLAGDYTFRTEGQKSQAYEIVEQLFWKAPDYVICPVGCGTNFHAIAKGFKEFYDFGLIDKMPKLIVVQTPGCNPVAKAIKQKRLDFDILDKPETVAAAMCVGNPIDGYKIIKDVYDSKGTSVEVTDAEILEAQQEQAREAGVFAEPSGAMGYAGIKKLAAKGFFKPDDVIVTIATGNGLKDPKSPLKVVPEPATLDCDFDEIKRFIDQKLYAIRNSSRQERAAIILKEAPKNNKEVVELVKNEFDVKITTAIAKEVLSNIKRFIEKGKAIKKADLQYMLESVLDELSLKNRVMEVKDFQIKTTLHTQAEAEIWAIAHGEEVHASAKGVGPVDAAIEALKKAAKANVWLTDYNVEIDSSGVDAAVEVKMALKDDQGHNVVVRSTSPDIIVASIKAFEKGVNILSNQNS